MPTVLITCDNDDDMTIYKAPMYIYRKNIPAQNFIPIKFKTTVRCFCNRKTGALIINSQVVVDAAVPCGVYQPTAVDVCQLLQSTTFQPITQF